MTGDGGGDTDDEMMVRKTDWLYCHVGYQLTT